MRKLLLLVLVSIFCFVVLSNGVHALDLLELEVNPVEESSFSLRPVIYSITVRNNQNLDDDFIILDNNQNESLSFELIELLRIINGLFVAKSSQQEMRNIALQKVKFRNNTKIIETLTEEQVHEIKNKYDPVLNKLAQDFLDQEKMFINDEYEAKAVKTSLNNQDVEDILTAFAADLK